MPFLVDVKLFKMVGVQQIKDSGRSLFVIKRGCSCYLGKNCRSIETPWPDPVWPQVIVSQFKYLSFWVRLAPLRKRTVRHGSGPHSHSPLSALMQTTTRGESRTPKLKVCLFIL